MLTGVVEIIHRELNGIGLRGPNDIVFDRQGSFWFTDASKGRARDMDRGSVYYARSDGTFIAEVVYAMFSPHGIGLSPHKDRLYVSETQTGRLWAFELDAPGVVYEQPFLSLNEGTLVCGLGGLRMMDGLAVDAQGNVCVATLFDGGMAVIAPSDELMRRLPMPDAFVTNICFGGEDLCRAYITLSQTGRLVSKA